MVEMMDYSVRPAAVELDEAVELPNSIQTPSQSKAIQDKLRKRQELREKFKEAFDGQTDEELGIVHRGIQVGESKVRYKQGTSSASIGMANGIYSLITNTKTQQVAKETESVSQRSLVKKTSASLSRRNVRRIAPSDEDKLYEDTREDSTLQWTVPNDLYTDKLNGGNKLISGSGRKPHMTWLQVLFYNLRIAWKRYLSRKLERIPFLRTQIKKIEGNFGVGIASFFVFVRLVITLNIILAVLWMSLVIIPAASKYDDSKVVTADRMYRDDEYGFHVRNLFDGRGVIADSLLFYGGYVRESFCDNSSCVESSCESSNCVHSTGACEYGPCSYRIDIAYMIMIFVSLFGPFFVLSWSYSESLNTSGSSSSENELVPFSTMVLTSWDHSLVSSEAVGNLSKGITNTLKDKLTEYRNAEKKKIQTKREKVKLILRRVVAWLISILLVAAATGSIVITIMFGPDIRRATENKDLVETLGEYFELYGTSVLFVIINALVPTLMFLLLPIEKYDSGKTEFNVTITRVFVVRILNLYALMAGWKISTNCGCVGEERKKGCNLEENVVCAGTYYGQELYKVTLLSIAATIFGQLILRFGYFYWFNKKKEFLIADAVLAVVYIQSVVWTGTAVCPFLPLIAAIGLLCLFFAYYFIVQYTCHPPIKRWSQSRQNSFFLFSLLAALVCVIIPVSITVQTDHVPLGSVIISVDSSEGNNSPVFSQEGNNSTMFSGESNSTLAFFGEGNYSLLFSNEDNNSLVFAGEGHYSVIFSTEYNDSLLFSSKGNYSLVFSGEGLYYDSLTFSSEENDTLVFSSAGNNSLVFYGEGNDSLIFSSNGDYSLTFSGEDNDSLIFSGEDNDSLIFSGEFFGEDNVIFSGEGNHSLIFSIEGNYTLTSFSGDSDTSVDEGSGTVSSCDQSLYCGPFRNRTALFAILPDKASDRCGVACELFYIIFSSAIGLPLIFCLMVALLQFSIRLNRAKKRYYSLLKELEMERQKVKIVLKDYHRVDLKLKEQQENQGHQNTDVASLVRATSRESL